MARHKRLTNYITRMLLRLSKVHTLAKSKAFSLVRSTVLRAKNHPSDGQGVVAYSASEFRIER